MTPDPIARALTEREYTEPTPVQRAVMAENAEGRDLVVSAQTGSGKTVAYGLAIAKTLLGDALRFEYPAMPVALIVAPTRELAMQVEREFEWLYHYTSARILSCVGGMDPKRERRRLADGAHIIVGTPGRLRDHLERHGDRAQWIVEHWPHVVEHHEIAEALAAAASAARLPGTSAEYWAVQDPIDL